MSLKLSRTYDYIDSHLDEHLERIKTVMRIPSIAAENPGEVRKCATLLCRWFDELGCVESRIFETAGSPVVYAHYDAKAKNTLLVYLMYDVKQVSGENWTLAKDPFDPQVIQMPPFRSVLVGRGAVNTKGPMSAFLNALFSIRAAGDELPVNLKFIAEGEEEMGSQHLLDFVQQNMSKFGDSDACLMPSAGQDIDGTVVMSLGCKGAVQLELECSGEHWRRGPMKRGIHSSLAAIVESPIWRMVQALATMVDPKDQSKVLVNNFYDNVALPSPHDLELINELVKVFDENALRKANDVEHFLYDLHGKDLLMKALYTTTLNIQGIYGGYTGPMFKTVLPHSMKVKLESRLIPNQTRTETLEKVRKHLDSNGYSDIKVTESLTERSHDWSRTDPNAGIVKVIRETYGNLSHHCQVWPFSLGSTPQYIFTKHIGVPFVAAGLGHGGRTHAPDEYYVIEGDGEKSKVAGLAEAEKFFVSLLYRLSECELNAREC